MLTAKNNHEHWFNVEGYKKCPLCGEQFDISIKPAIVSNNYEDESPASCDNGVRRRVGQKRKNASSN